MKGIGLIILLVMLCGAQVSAQQLSKEAQKEWEQMRKSARKADKLMMVKFDAPWCKQCVRLEAETINHTQVRPLIDDNFIYQTVDTEFFTGLELASKFNVNVYPTILIINKKGMVEERYEGFYAPNYFLNLLTTHLTD